MDGEISSRDYIDGTLFMEIGRQNLTVVEFDPSDRFEEGEEVTVEGTVRIYRGEIEIVADSIQ